MRDFYCYLLNEKLQNSGDLKPLEKDLLKNHYSILVKKDSSDSKDYTGYKKSGYRGELKNISNLFDVENNEFLEYSYILILQIENRLMFITDRKKPTEKLQNYIQWDFALKIALNRNYSNNSDMDMSFNIERLFVQSINKNSSKSQLKQHFDGKEYIKFHVNYNLKKLMKMGSSLLKIYNENSEDLYFTYLKQINYKNDDDLNLHINQILRKTISNKENLIIRYPSTKYFDKSEFMFSYKDQMKIYEDMGSIELENFISFIEIENKEINFQNVLISQADHIDKFNDQYSIMDLVEFEFTFDDNKYIHKENFIYLIDSF